MNKHILGFLMCLFCICMNVVAQTDSLLQSSGRFARITVNTDLSAGKIRGFVPGDSISYVLRKEKAILEAQGDDFLYYRVLCDSILSAEISYTFDANGLLISVAIEFFESCKHKLSGNLSDEFLMNLHSSYKNCLDIETGSFQCESETGVRVDYQKIKSEMCVIHTQIEFY